MNISDSAGFGAWFRRFENSAASDLGDFTTSKRVLRISLLAIVIGLASAGIAFLLLRLIAFFTNLFFFQTLSFSGEASPASNTLGLLILVVPVVGGLIIGLMARYGSDRIRGHGIPEAIEAILLNGSKVQPKIALLKPLSSAISIGSGGPFGAEGPIIMTGGAFGSMIAQFFHLTSAERKTLLVAGAAAGMSATFAAPVASVLLAVELLLFEWKPRSLIPVALASAAAAAARTFILGHGPLFPIPAHPSVGLDGLASCLLVGILAGVLSLLLTKAVYASEDIFAKLPIHWMWWPAIGGLVIGLGGLIFPQALGVGYDTIGSLLQGTVPLKIIAGILIVKSTIWAVSLGSGTSGGVLAPLLMMGGALGGLEAMILPAEGAGFWPLISMGAILGGTMRSPLTGIVFAFELTHDINSLLPLLIAVTTAHGFTVLTLGRSILTEKIERRGYHMSREYALDPLEITFAREVMRTDIVVLPASLTLKELANRIPTDLGRRVQHMYPVVDAEDKFVGVVTRRELRTAIQQAETPSAVKHLSDITRYDANVVYDDEPLRVVVERMASTGLTRFPVVDRERPREIVGSISLNNLLAARVYHFEAETRREQVLQLPRLKSKREANADTPEAA